MGGGSVGDASKRVYHAANRGFEIRPRAGYFIDSLSSQAAEYTGFVEEVLSVGVGPLGAWLSWGTSHRSAADLWHPLACTSALCWSPYLKFIFAMCGRTWMRSSRVMSRRCVLLCRLSCVVACSSWHRRYVLHRVVSCRAAVSVWTRVCVQRAHT